MPDELTELLPTVSLAGAMFGLWLTATRDSVRKAIEAEYSRTDDPEPSIKMGVWLVWISIWVPIAVLGILFSTIWGILSNIDFDAKYSPTRAFFLVVVVIWIFLLFWSGRDVYKVQKNSRAVGRDRRRLTG